MRSDASPELVLMPGLGADADLFYPQIDHFGDRLWVCTGLTPQQLEGQTPSMEWAAQHSAKIISTQLRPDRPYILGGMSFGGSLAMEMARFVDPKPSAIVLISCNRTAETIPASFRFNRFLGSLLPHSMIRYSLSALSRVFSNREGLSAEGRDRLLAMANRAEIPSLLWGAAAVAKWQFDESHVGQLHMPIYQIHGQSDWVIPKHQPHLTEEITGARHLITWTHAERINHFIEQVLEETLTCRAY